MRLLTALAAGIVLTGGAEGSVPYANAQRPAGQVATTPNDAFPVVSALPPASPTTKPTVSLRAAREAGVVPGPAVATLAIPPDRAARALAAFQASCPALLRRSETSGLTEPLDWTEACTAASTSPDPLTFFRCFFETVQVGDGAAYATGYYEPEIEGSRQRDDTHRVPVYGKPSDLVELDLGAFSGSLKGKSIRGRLIETGFVPYFDRADIENGVLAGRAPEIAWAADPIEFFFLQVQGSGRLRLADGSVMRIGYAAQNGRDYTGIGSLMRDRGLIVPGQLSMQGIMDWLRTHPDQSDAILRENKSYVFFREIVGDGPIGALGLTVVPHISVAADPAFVPLGAPVWLDLDRPEATGLWIAQDTGGAIKGANRFDTFWGAGREARRIAGGMSGRGRALILVPVGTAARLAAVGNGTAP